MNESILKVSGRVPFRRLGSLQHNYVSKDPTVCNMGIRKSNLRNELLKEVGPTLIEKII